jgi:hypothetical protein
MYANSKVCSPVRMHTLRGILTLAGGLTFACSAHDGGTSDPIAEGQAGTAPNTTKDQHPSAPPHTYSIDLGGEHKITYAAFEDGAMIITEQGNIASDKPAGLIGMSPGQAFRSLHPGETVPKEFVEAEAFFSAQGNVEGEGVPPATMLNSTVDAPPAAGLIPKDVTSDPNTFLNNFGCFFGSTDIAAICLTNRGEWANYSGTSRWAIYKVAPYLGDITVNLGVAGHTSVFPVFQGNFSWSWARGALKTHSKYVLSDNRTYYKTYPDTASQTFQITDAAGDQFHFSIRLNNYQFSGPNCTETSNSDWSYWESGSTTSDCLHSHYN